MKRFNILCTLVVLLPAVMAMAKPDGAWKWDSTDSSSSSNGPSTDANTGAKSALNLAVAGKSTTF